MFNLRASLELSEEGYIEQLSFLKVLYPLAFAAQV